ncbi:hypothetical protein GCM10028805_36910 [Spirosoma harenae]
MKFLLALVLACLTLTYCPAQQTTVTLSKRMFDANQLINLSSMRGWVFKAGHNPAWASPGLNTSDWAQRTPSTLSVSDTDKTGRAEGWFRLAIRLDSTFSDIPLGASSFCWTAMDLYIDGRLITSFGQTGADSESYREHYPYYQPAIPLELTADHEHLIALHVVDYVSPFSTNLLKGELEDGTSKLIRIVGPKTFDWLQNNPRFFLIYSTLWLAVSFLLTMLYWLLALQDLYEKTTIQLLAIGESFLVLYCMLTFGDAVFQPPFIVEVIIYRLGNVFLCIAIAFLPITLWRILKYPPSWLLTCLLIGISVVGAGLTAYTYTNLFSSIATIFDFLLFFWLLIWKRNQLQGAQWAIVVGAFLTIGFALSIALLLISGANDFTPCLLPLGTGFFLSLPLSLLVYLVLRIKEIVAEDRAKATAVMQITEEKRQLLATQNQRLEQQVEARTAELKASQAQLIQKEKLASLGELTAGIAHEIQNPLNFVNNFSEVSAELVDELKAELAKGDLEEANFIADDLASNLQKINHHGGRASSIVKGMLEHSRTESGEKRPTNLNALADEYLKIAYHGLKAKDKSFNCQLITDFDPTLEPIEVAPQEIGRVLLNLYNNAFYAVSEHARRTNNPDYQPAVTVRSKRAGDRVEIRVLDNGTGIAESEQSKIFQPFFTTKPTGEGTGLGLSLSYDIITKGHGGSLRVESLAGEGSTFVIEFPLLYNQIPTSNIVA